LLIGGGCGGWTGNKVFFFFCLLPVVHPAICFFPQPVGVKFFFCGFGGTVPAVISTKCIPPKKGTGPFVLFFLSFFPVGVFVSLRGICPHKVAVFSFGDHPLHKLLHTTNNCLVSFCTFTQVGVPRFFGVVFFRFSHQTTRARTEGGGDPFFGVFRPVFLCNPKMAPLSFFWPPPPTPQEKIFSPLPPTFVLSFFFFLSRAFGSSDF